MSEKPSIVRFISNIEDAKEIAYAFAQSGVFPDARSAAAAFVKLISGREMGFGVTTSMNSLHFINGNLTLGALAIGSRIRTSGRYDFKVLEHTSEICRIEFFRGDRESGVSEGVSEFTIEDAKLADAMFFTKNKEPAQWTKYPRNMLYARAISNGYRWYAPDIFDGAAVYTADELNVESDADGVLIDPDVVTVKAMKDEPIDVQAAAEEAAEALHAAAANTTREPEPEVETKPRPPAFPNPAPQQPEQEVKPADTKPVTRNVMRPSF